MAPALLAIFPKAPEMAAPPMAPPSTALHVFCQSHFPGLKFLEKTKVEIFLLLFYSLIIDFYKQLVDFKLKEKTPCLLHV
ncbi:hypothetical protein C1637_15255 [Chryseobacterium lactis]|uniref:Uncharacterized protein n=1 Tax=Chryseobacterium lactis TaxID=1241981 RepID=A0A3G6RPG9_CHRLC|nr:hypothetical protein [Chryseobacterium lactis]AZA83530.1 hypothetical protein EG342_17310 [Chryseobacterium lactis]AZB03914.1 hypothetical protein EG341_08185 [Chryseobacterium lactis]PNW13176.1 hypothetical protein C1637_15255 [Chryseobacterium lactis]